MILALNNRTARAGTESGARGVAPEKPGPKPGQRPGFSQAARPLAGAEFLVAVGGPYPGEVGRKKRIESEVDSRTIVPLPTPMCNLESG